MKRFTTILVYLLLLAIPLASVAQEKLTTILERGYPAQWLVCGPFESDLPQGIIEAVANGQVPLGRNDFMASRGGIKNVRPSHSLQVDKPDGIAIWLNTRSEDSTVDLSPFFKAADSGIAFAAFYAVTPNDQAVLFDLQSALGARVFHNGVEVKEVSASPLSLGGVDNFEVTFTPGTNLIMLEVPGAKVEALASVFGQTPQAFMQSQFQNRTKLSVETGFEFKLTLQAMRSFEGIRYAPKLESTGTFTGQGDNIFQDAWLTLFNPGDTPSSELKYTGTATGAAHRFQKTIAAIPPNSIHRELISIPVSKRTPGQQVRVNSMLSMKRESEKWVSNVIAKRKPMPAQYHLVTVPTLPDAATTSQSDIIERYRSDLMTNMLRNNEN